MASGLKTWRIIVLSILLVLSNWQHRACGSSPQVPCLFMFGDSLFDNGNNMVLATDVKASYLPYGVDFPYGSTGRCSNGLNLADVIGFKITDKGCCDVPTGEIPCAPLTYPCLNRDEHVYWDGAHYTEARARIFAKRAYKRQFPVDAYPYDISELAKVPNDEADGCKKTG
ncbi:hypothetical protein D5086_023858 [Populus alba]|uniref:Uncharacterized protein n=1 Tax=Populus alba TaxID=43335 RepID=A0ACC4BB17_POPAL